MVTAGDSQQGKYFNMLPGDTKLSAKWSPGMRYSPDPGERGQWSLVVSQISHYSSKLDTRYGFIITDKHLVVFRVAREVIGSGLASTRARRTQTAYLGAGYGDDPYGSSSGESRSSPQSIGRQSFNPDSQIDSGLQTSWEQ